MGITWGIGVFTDFGFKSVVSDDVFFWTHLIADFETRRWDQPFVREPCCKFLYLRE